MILGKICLAAEFFQKDMIIIFLIVSIMYESQGMDMKQRSEALMNMMFM